MGINKRWIQQRESMLSYAKEGPEKEELRAELEAAKAQYSKEQEELKAFKKRGFIPNKHEVRCDFTGKKVLPYEGFVRREGLATRLWICYCREEAEKKMVIAGDRDGWVDLVCGKEEKVSAYLEGRYPLKISVQGAGEDTAYADRLVRDALSKLGWHVSPTAGFWEGGEGEDEQILHLRPDDVRGICTPVKPRK